MSSLSLTPAAKEQAISSTSPSTSNSTSSTSSSSTSSSRVVTQAPTGQSLQVSERVQAVASTEIDRIALLEQRFAQLQGTVEYQQRVITVQSQFIKKLQDDNHLLKLATSKLLSDSQVSNPNFSLVFKDPVITEFAGLLHQGLSAEFSSITLGMQGKLTPNFNPISSTSAQMSAAIPVVGTITSGVMQAAISRYNFGQIKAAASYLLGDTGLPPFLAYHLTLEIAKNPKVQAELKGRIEASRSSSYYEAASQAATTVGDKVLPNVHNSNPSTMYARECSNRVVDLMVNYPVEVHLAPKLKLQNLTKLNFQKKEPRLLQAPPGIRHLPSPSSRSSSSSSSISSSSPSSSKRLNAPSKLKRLPPPPQLSTTVAMPGSSHLQITSSSSSSSSSSSRNPSSENQAMVVRAHQPTNSSSSSSSHGITVENRMLSAFLSIFDFGNSFPPLGGYNQWN